MALLVSNPNIPSDILEELLNHRALDGIRWPTPEESEALRLVYIKFLQLELEHPELTNMSREQIIRKLHDEDALHDYPAQQTALRAESYFNYKDKMAANGINVFDPQIEHQFSSNKVKRERANLMVAYLEKYPQMLPDSLDLKKNQNKPR